MKKAALAVGAAFVILGTVYGLGRAHVIPLGPLGPRKSAKRPHGAAGPSVAPAAAAAKGSGSAQPAATSLDPLAAERAQLAAQAQELKAEKASLERMPAGSPASTASPGPAALDPQSVSRLAGVYSEMPPDAAARILGRMPAADEITLLRKMDDKQVAAILQLAQPAQAAHLTEALAQPPPPPPDAGDGSGP